MGGGANAVIAEIIDRLADYEMLVTASKEHDRQLEEVFETLEEHEALIEGLRNNGQ